MKKKTQCDGCNYVTDCESYDDNNAERKGTMRLCDLCANTYTGTVARFPSQYGDSQFIMKTICYVANAVIERAEKEK